MAFLCDLAALQEHIFTSSPMRQPQLLESSEREQTNFHKKDFDLLTSQFVFLVCNIHPYTISQRVITRKGDHGGARQARQRTGEYPGGD